MSAGIMRFDLGLTSPREMERIRRACIEEGLLDEDDLLELDDFRLFTPENAADRSKRRRYRPVS